MQHFHGLINPHTKCAETFLLSILVKLKFTKKHVARVSELNKVNSRKKHVKLVKKEKREARVKA